MPSPRTVFHTTSALVLSAAALPVAVAPAATASSTVIASQDFEGNTLSRGIPADFIAIALNQYDTNTGLYNIPGLNFDSGVGLGWTADTDAVPPVGTAPDALSDNGDVIGVVFDDDKDWGTTNGLSGAPGQTGNFYLVEDADSTWTVTFDPIDTTGFTDLELSFTWGIDNDGAGVPAGAGSNFEVDDFFEVLINGTSVFRVDGAGDFSAGDATGGLDDLNAPYINAFAPETVDLSAFDGQTLNMSFVIANNTAPEDIAFDNVVVSGMAGLLGDLDGDGDLDVDDINILGDNLGLGTTPEEGDIDGDNDVDADDLAAWLALVGTVNGDANLDLKVDTSDLAILAGNFNNPVTSYDQADFNLDDQVDTSDLAILAGTFGIDNTAPVAAALVPEPTTLTLIGLAGLAAMSRRRP